MSSYVVGAIGSESSQKSFMVLRSTAIYQLSSPVNLSLGRLTKINIPVPGLIAGADFPIYCYSPNNYFAIVGASVLTNGYLTVWIFSNTGLGLTQITIDLVLARF